VLCIVLSVALVMGLLTATRTYQAYKRKLTSKQTMQQAMRKTATMGVLSAISSGTHSHSAASSGGRRTSEAAGSSPPISPMSPMSPMSPTMSPMSPAAGVVEAMSPLVQAKMKRVSLGGGADATRTASFGGSSSFGDGGGGGGGGGGSSGGEAPGGMLAAVAALRTRRQSEVGVFEQPLTGGFHGGLQRRPSAAMLEAMASLPEEQRAQLEQQRLQQVLAQLKPAARLDLLREMQLKLTQAERLAFAEEVVDYFYEFGADAPRRASLLHGFGLMSADDKVGLLQELVASVPIHRRAEALQRAWEGTGEEEQAPSLSLLLRSAAPDVRRRAFQLLDAAGSNPDDFPAAERVQLLKLGTKHAPRHAEAQTDLSVEAIIAKAEAVSAAAAAAEAVESANWEQRAAERRKAAQSAVDDNASGLRTAIKEHGRSTSPVKAAKRLPPAGAGGGGGDPVSPGREEEGGGAGGKGEKCIFGAAYSAFFGGQKVASEQSLTLPNLLPKVAELLALKVGYDGSCRREGKPRMSLPHFLCAHHLREAGLRSKARKSLAMLLHAARLHAPTNVRVKLFAEGAGLLAFPFEEPTCELVFHTLVVLYGETQEQVTHHMALPPGATQLHLTRDEADAARVLAGPVGRGSSSLRSWGSVEELLDGTRLPAHLRADVAKKAAQRAAPMQLDAAARKAALQAVAAGGAGAGASLEGDMGLSTDELLLLVLNAWRAHRQQQAEMLSRRFHEADANGDQVLDINEFWDCLRALPAAAAKGGASVEGGAAGRGPSGAGVIDRSSAESLFNEVLLESERGGGPAALAGGRGAAGDVLSVEAFTTVMLRHGIYDDDYGRAKRNAAA
jgi:hypothetical protein